MWHRRVINTKPLQYTGLGVFWRYKKIRAGILMGQRFCVMDESPFTSQIKSLADEELLDFWAETQHLECMIRSEFNQSVSLSPDYESMILFELQIRSFQRAMPECA